MNGEHLKTWKKVKRNLLLTVFLLSQCSMTRTVHSKVENILVVAAQGKETPRTQKNSFLAESRRSIGKSEISFQMVTVSSICTSTDYRLPTLYSICYHSPLTRPHPRKDERMHPPLIWFFLRWTSLFHQPSYIQTNWNKESKIMYKSPWFASGAASTCLPVNLHFNQIK